MKARLGIAWRYLTVLPLPGDSAAGDLGRAAVWFPVVGLILGAVLAAAAAGAGRVVPPPLAALLVVGAWAGLTGGLHLDGLADAADGLGGGWSREERLAIMRDPGTGAYGVTAVVLVLGAKTAALAGLPDDLAWRGLLAAPAIGRLVPVLIARLCGPARAEGAGHAFVLAVRAPALLAAAVVGVGVPALLLGVWGIAMVFPAAAAAPGFAVYLQRRLGGVTGDCLGASIETSEALALATLASLAHLGVWGPA